MTEDQANLLIVQLVRIADALENRQRQEPPIEGAMLTTAQLAARWSLSEEKVRDMRARGEIFAVKLGERVWRYPLAEVVRFEEGVERPGGNVYRLGSRPKGTR